MRSVPRRVAVVVGLACAALSCGREATGPVGVRGTGQVALAPVFPSAVLGPNGSSLVAFDRVRIVLRRTDGSIAVDRLVDFPSTADSVALSLSVTLANDAPAAGEPMTLSMGYINAAGDTVFRGGPQQITVAVTKPGDPAPAPVNLPLTYSGPGSTATRVVLTPDSITLRDGEQSTLTARAFDASNTVLSGTPVRFRSSDTTIATVSDAGVVTARARRGTTRVIAQLLTGPADTMTVAVTLKASLLQAVSGTGQSAQIGALLAAPVVVRALAADSVPVAGVAVTFATATGNGTPGTTTVTTDATGRASTTWTLGSTVGTQTLTASATGLTGSPVTFTATATPGAPTQLAIIAPPTFTIAGQTIDPAIVVEARTAGGIRATGFSDTVRIALGTNPNDGALLGTVAVAAVNGVATFSTLAIQRAATGYTLVASASGLTSATSAPFNILSASPKSLVFVQQPTGGSPGVALSPAPTVRGLDAFGNVGTLTGGVTISLGANPGGATLGGTVTVNASGGVATFSNLTISAPGTGYTLVASAALLTSTTSTPFDITAGTATKLVITTQPSTSAAGQPIAPAIVVEAQTASGTRVTTFTDSVRIALESNPANGILSGTRTVAAVNGVATFSDLSIDKVGSSYSLLVTSGSLSADLSSAFAITAGAAQSLRFGQQPVGGGPGQVLTPAPTVRAVDALGNLATTFTGSVTVTLGNAGTATLGGTLSVNAVAGIATFSDLTVSAVGEGYFLNAASPGLTSVPSASFAIGAGVNAWANAAGGNWSVGTNWSLGRPPLLNETAEIALAGTYTVTMDVSDTVSAVRLGTGSSGTQTLVMTGRSLTASTVLVGSRGILRSNSSALIAASGVSVSGTLIASGSNSITGALEVSEGGIVRVGQVDGCCSLASLTVSTGVTNAGTIELTNAFTAAYGATLTVTNGTLLNATTGVIASLGGQSPGGTRTLQAALDNRGQLVVRTPLTVTKSGAVHLNLGTIDADSANLSLQANGSTATFTNRGRITMTTGRILTLSGGGSFVNDTAGTITGGALLLSSVTGVFRGAVPGVTGVELTNATVTVDAAIGSATQAWAVTNSTLTAPGGFTHAAGQTLLVKNSTIAGPWTNAGTVTFSGNSAISGALTNLEGAILRVSQVDGCCSSANLTVANGFTNAGTIELTNAYTAAYGATLQVTAGTVVNASTGTIAVLGGQSPGGLRAMITAFENRGRLVVRVPLTIGRAQASHLNLGTIDADSANLTINQSGTGATFTNRGTITQGASRTLAVSSGAFINDSTATISGGTLSLNSVTATFRGAVPAVTAFLLASSNATFDGALNTSVQGWTITTSTVTSSSGFTNATGQTLTLKSSILAAPLVNQGTLITSGTNTISGAFSNAAGAVLRVAQIDGCCSNSFLTIANGFTNAGTIELSNAYSAAYSAQLAVTSGALVNAATGVIAALGGQSPGGARTLNADLRNEGQLLVRVPLTLSRTGSAHLNTGTIDADSANLSVTLGSTATTFTNRGTIRQGAARTLTLTNGTFGNDSTGTITGGTVTLNSTTATFRGAVPAVAAFIFSSSNVTFDAALSSAVQSWTIGSSSVTTPGGFTNASGQTLTLRSSTIAGAVTNQGVFNVSGFNTVNGLVTNGAGATLRVAQSDGCCGTASLTAKSGLANAGTLELTNAFSAAYGATLTVEGGALVNASTGVVAVLGGQSPGGARALNAQLENQGQFLVRVPLTMGLAGAVHLNTGTIDADSANLTIDQIGATAKVVNQGTIRLGTGRTLTVNTGRIELAAGSTLVGAGTLAPVNATLVLEQDLSNAATQLRLAGTTVNGPGTLTNVGERTLTLLNGTTIAAPLVNQGTLVASGNAAITGTFANASSAVLRIGQIDGCCNPASLNVTNGFTNAGTIELTNAFTAAYGAQLTVMNGTLVNATTGTIAALGGQTPGGARALQAALDNRGQLLVRTPLTLNKSGAVHLNSGTIDADSANFTITQSGTGASFTTSGTMRVGTEKTLAVTGGSFVVEGGTFGGPGTMTFTNAALTMGQDFSNAVTALQLSNTTVSGPGTVTNAVGRTMTILNGTTIAAPFVNLGTLRVSGTTSISGTLTNAAGAVLRVGQVDGCCNPATLTVANGFTNAGTIELTNAFSAAYGAQLAVTTGTLVNAPTGTIAALGGQTPGGVRTLQAALDNQGQLLVRTPLTLSKAGAVHVNSGTIDADSANFTITQSGTGASFTTSGTLRIGLGKSLAVSGGSLTVTSGATFGGPGTIGFANTALILQQDLTNAVTKLEFGNSTVSGPGTLINAADRTLTITNGTTITAPLVNQGTLITSGSTSISGALTNALGATLRVAQVDGCCNPATLTVANGFTNAGTIELTNAFSAAYGAQLAVTTGTLVNTPTGTIAALGGQTPGGARTLQAALDNRGQLLVRTPLTLSKAGAVHLNSGTIDADSANLTITQSGTGASFTTSGTLRVGTGKTLAVTGGSFVVEGGTFGGPGTMSFTNAALTLGQDLSNAVTALQLSNTSVSGPGTLTNAVDRTLTITNGTAITAPLVNQGTLIASGSTSISGAFTNALGAILRVAQVDGCCNPATLTVATGFTNAGTIELSNAFTAAYGAQLTVTTGTLVNASTGVIAALGGQTPGGTRTLSGAIDNQGLLQLFPNAAGRLRITGTFTNSGTIEAELGGTTVATQYDQLEISGTSTLGGTLKVGLINSFTPVATNSFTLINHVSGTRSGTFASILPPAGVTLNPAYTSTAVTLTVP